MESLENVNESRKKEELSKLFLNFLKAIAQKAKAELGPNPKRIQQSVWWVCNDSKSMNSCAANREIINNREIFKRYTLKWKHDDFPEKQQLEMTLLAWFSETKAVYILVSLDWLLSRWLNQPKPFEFEEPVTSNLLDEFIEFALNDIIITKSRFAIEGLNVANLPLFFEKGIVIRKITEEELWDLGEIDLTRFIFSHSPYFPPKDSWKILEIELKYRRESYLNPYIILGAILALLRLGSSGAIQTIDLGTETNFGSGRGFAGNPMPRDEYFDGKYDLNEGLSQRLHEAWPIMRKIMESDQHYLRLPAQRLLEGSVRKKFEDAILDYAIGLERLLTAGLRVELGYRFALRGATILSWAGGDKQAFFNNLQDFYNLRSFIIHGSKVSKKEKSRHSLSPSGACSIGEDYLRKIWWWYFENGFVQTNDLDAGTKKIDDRILSNFCG